MNKVALVEETTLQESVLYNPIKEMAGIIFPSFFKEGESIEFNLKT